MVSFENVRVPWPGWKVVKELGEGGYGKVYEIERTQHSIRDADALKIIRIPRSRQEYDSLIYCMKSEDSVNEVLSEQKNKLINEIKAMQKLKANDNIVSIKDWSVEKLDDGYSWEVYIRMDVLTPLKDHIKAKKPEEEEIIRLGIDICKALAQCETENIVHRDIKPDNIMVSPSGKYMLADFGIARYLEEATTMTGGVGTDLYMAPEVAHYEKADKTVDIYSLGLVLYELLNNNRPPFINAEGKYSAIDRHAAILRRLNGEELPEPAFGSDELKRIVLKASSAEKSMRYDSAQAMLIELEALASGEIRVNASPENRISKLFHDAENGSYEAQMELGKCYENGFDVEQNYEEAVKWYNLAAEQGKIEALDCLDRCYKELKYIYFGKMDEMMDRNSKTNAKNKNTENKIDKPIIGADKFIEMLMSASEKRHAESQNKHSKTDANTENKKDESPDVSERKNSEVKIERESHYHQVREKEPNYEYVYRNRIAAERGFAKAQNELGYFYSIGYCVEQNYEEAVKWFTLAAEQGVAAAQYNLGCCYNDGYGVEQNYDEAIKWFRLADEQGYAAAQNKLQDIYCEIEEAEQDLEETLKWYRHAAEQGDAKAQNYLGYCYDNGEGVGQNYKKAVKWYRLAAEQGYAKAQHNLGCCYHSGDGVKQNFEEAVRWYRLAAEQGDGAAQFNLGYCYDNGEGVEQNCEEAVKWYKLAAEQGYKLPYLSIGPLYYGRSAETI